MKKFLIALAVVVTGFISVACGSTDNSQSDVISEDDSIVIVSDDENQNEEDVFDEDPDYIYELGWSYADQSNWEFLSGNKQSPINIETIQASDMTDEGTIVLNYTNGNEQVIDTGYDIQVAKSGTAIINGRNFQLLQYHFHSDSEHLIDGEQFPAEVHFVHINEAGRLAVIGVLLTEGEENEALGNILANFEFGETVEIEEGIDVSSLIPDEKAYFHYLGSLTTPPLNENVEWYVMQNPVEISAEQIEALKEIYDGNNRQVQPLNGRLLLQHNPS